MTTPPRGHCPACRNLDGSPSPVPCPAHAAPPAVSAELVELRRLAALYARHVDPRTPAAVAFAAGYLTAQRDAQTAVLRIPRPPAPAARRGS